MKRFLSSAMVLSLFLIPFAAATASDCPQATTTECVAKCQEAIAYAQEHGTEALFEQINKKDGPFVWKDSYVFAVEAQTAKMLAHPLPFYQSFIGRSLLPVRDADGRPVWKRIMKDAEAGSCWSVYPFVPKPGADPRVKVTYFELVPDTNVLVASGITP
jgi:signal transduction histidine kinase